MSFELPDNQLIVMVFVKKWVNTQKTAVPHKEVIDHMESQDIHRGSVENALTSLIKKGYIRRAFSERRNARLYIMCRNI